MAMGLMTFFMDVTDITVFILKGIATVLVAVIAFFMIYDFPETTSFLTEEQREFVAHRLKYDGTLGAWMTNFTGSTLSKLLSTGKFIFLYSFSGLHSCDFLLPLACSCVSRPLYSISSSFHCPAIRILRDPRTTIDGSGICLRLFGLYFDGFSLRPCSKTRCIRIQPSVSCFRRLHRLSFVQPPWRQIRWYLHCSFRSFSPSSYLTSRNLSRIAWRRVLVSQ